MKYLVLLLFVGCNSNSPDSFKYRDKMIQECQTACAPRKSNWVNHRFADADCICLEEGVTK